MKTTYRKVGICTISLVVLISLASATTLDFYGKINSITTIQPPKFYASSEEAIVGYKLLINSPPATYQEISFSDGSPIVFLTNPLGINSFYPATYSFSVKAKANNLNKVMYLEFVVVHEDGSYTPVCSTNITITSTEYQIYEASCDGPQLTLQPSDKFGWIMKGAFADVTYYVMPDGSTRIEISYGSRDNIGGGGPGGVQIRSQGE